MKSNFSHVFQPIRIRGIDFKNRITLAPPSPNLASEDGLVTHEMVNWFRMFARGGVSTIYAGNCSIDLYLSRCSTVAVFWSQNDTGHRPQSRSSRYLLPMRCSPSLCLLDSFDAAILCIAICYMVAYRISS